MKKTFIKYITLLLLIIIFGIICGGCVDNKHISEGELLRLHIRADSNSDVDQRVKLKVRDDIVAFLTEQNKDVTTFEEAYSKISSLLHALKQIADMRLKEEGMSYVSEVKLTREYFPTRSYENVVVDSGIYDALIINLGSGQGDNWWCVVYPPLCYLEATSDFRYKSKFKELIDKYFGTFRYGRCFFEKENNHFVFGGYLRNFRNVAF